MCQPQSGLSCLPAFLLLRKRWISLFFHCPHALVGRMTLVCMYARFFITFPRHDLSCYYPYMFFILFSVHVFVMLRSAHILILLSVLAILCVCPYKCMCMCMWECVRICMHIHMAAWACACTHICTSECGCTGYA